MDNWGQGTFTLCVPRLYRRAVRVAQEFHPRIGRVVVVIRWRVADALVEHAEVRVERRPAPGLCFSLFEKARARLQQGTVGRVLGATAALTVLLTERRQLCIQFGQVD